MRKANNMRARMQRSLSAVLRTNHVAVINIDPSGKQGMINYKNCKNVPPGPKVAAAMCDYAHKWTLYVAGLCVDQAGNKYVKAEEIAPQGVYLAAHLTDVIEQTYQALVASCNPAHLVGSGWLAIPDDVTIDEAQAYKLFEAVGAWDQQKEIAA